MARAHDAYRPSLRYKLGSKNEKKKEEKRKKDRRVKKIEENKQGKRKKKTRRKNKREKKEKNKIKRKKKNPVLPLRQRRAIKSNIMMQINRGNITFILTQPPEN